MTEPRAVKNIYISPADEPVWKKIHEAANAENRGVGYFLCRIFEKKGVSSADKN